MARDVTHSDADTGDSQRQPTKRTAVEKVHKERWDCLGKPTKTNDDETRARATPHRPSSPIGPHDESNEIERTADADTAVTG